MSDRKLDNGRIVGQFRCWWCSHLYPILDRPWQQYVMREHVEQAHPEWAERLGLKRKEPEFTDN